MPVVHQTKEEVFAIRAEKEAGTSGIGGGKMEGREGVGGGRGWEAEENGEGAGRHHLEEGGVREVDAHHMERRLELIGRGMERILEGLVDEEDDGENTEREDAEDKGKGKEKEKEN